MKSRELIARLLEADPTGQLEVVVGCDDIYSVAEYPAYFDGTPLLLVRDEARRPLYDVVGLRCMASGERKLRIDTMGLRDVLADCPDVTVVYSDEHAERQCAQVEAVRAEMKGLPENK